MSWEIYVDGFKISAFTHCTSLDKFGGWGDDVTDDHDGSPERLFNRSDLAVYPLSTARYSKHWLSIYLNDTTSQPRTTAYLQILEPRNPFPPATTIFRFRASLADVVIAWRLGSLWCWLNSPCRVVPGKHALDLNEITSAKRTIKFSRLGQAESWLCLTFYQIFTAACNMSSSYLHTSSERASSSRSYGLAVCIRRCRITSICCSKDESWYLETDCKQCSTKDLLFLNSTVFWLFFLVKFIDGNAVMITIRCHSMMRAITCLSWLWRAQIFKRRISMVRLCLLPLTSSPGLQTNYSLSCNTIIPQIPPRIHQFRERWSP